MELGWLSAPGVPGPRGARLHGPPFDPLRRTQAAEVRAAVEASAAAEAEADAEAAAAKAAEAAQQQAEEAAATTAAISEEWGASKDVGSRSSGGVEDREVDLASLSARQRRIRAKSLAQKASLSGGGTSLGSGRSESVQERGGERAGAVDQPWEQRRSLWGRSRDEGGQGGDRGWGQESDEDVGAPLLPRDMEP